MLHAFSSVEHCSDLITPKKEQCADTILVVCECVCMCVCVWSCMHGCVSATEKESLSGVMKRYCVVSDATFFVFSSICTYSFVACRLLICCKVC